MFTTDGSNVYEHNGIGNGICTETSLGHFCIVDSTSLFSLAYHQDTLYVITTESDLYQIDLSHPSSCRFLTNFDMPPQETPRMIAMVCDKSGLIYMVDANSDWLYEYDPHKNTYSILGTMPSPDGDLIFYGDTLLYSGNGAALYAVNLANPAASSYFMGTGRYSFYGLMAAPGNCKENRFYGESSDGTVVEFDPAAKKLVNVLCGTDAFLDGASTLEDGTVSGLRIDSLELSPACAGTGTVKVNSSGLLSDSTSYVLDDTVHSNTGTFSTVPDGRHNLHVQLSAGCFVDSSFVLQPLLPAFSLQTVNPINCGIPNGSIQVAMDSSPNLLSYSLNGGPPQARPDFLGLKAGLYVLAIDYGKGCELDTGVTLRYQQPTAFPATITVDPAVCTQADGSIGLILLAGTDPQNISVALNTNPPRSALNFGGLAGGTDTLHLNLTSGCHFDSVIIVPNTLNPEPHVQTDVKNQVCLADNGSVALSISGPDSPYLSGIAGSSLSPVMRYSNLAPGSYNIQIIDKDLCTWDTTIVVQPYTMDSVSATVDTTNPSCTALNSGSVVINISGNQSPYFIGFAAKTFQSGTPIDSLTYGNLAFAVTNKDGCLVDSIYTTLSLDVSPECSLIYVPNAFSPNGDGHNDYFRAVHSPYQTGVRLQVYSRSGQQLFASSDQIEGWDGTYHGSAQPAGAYVWTLDYVDWDKQPKTLHGFVLLIR